MIDKFYYSRWFAPVFFFVLNVLFLFPFFFGGKVPIDSNPLYRSYPWKAEANFGSSAERFHARDYHHVDQTLQLFPIRNEIRKQLWNGQAPLWTDLVFCGAPLLGNPVSAFGISSIFHYLFGNFVGYTLMILFQFVLMGWFMFLLCEELGCSRLASLTAGVAFMWNGYLLRWFGVISFVETLVWMPLLIYFAHRCYKRRDWWSFHGLAFAVLAQFLGEHSQNWLYNLILLFVFSIWLLIRSAHRMAFTAKICGAVLLGTLLAMPELISFYTAFQNSPRSVEAVPLYQGRNHISPRKLITLAIPDFYGRTDLNVFSRLILKPESEGQGSIWRRLLLGEVGSVYNRLWAYIGLIPLILALVSFGDNRTRFWMYLGLLPPCLLVALNLEIFNRVVQAFWFGFNMLDQTRLLIFTVFSFCVLSAYGFDRLLSDEARIQRVVRLAIYGAAFLGIAMIVLFCASTLFAGSLKASAYSYFTNQKNLDNAFSFYTEGVNAIPEMFSQSLPILLFPCLLLAAFASFLSTKKATPITLLLLTILDLFYHGRTDPPVYFSSPAALYPSLQSLQFLAAHQDQFRVMEIQSRRPFLEKPLNRYSQLSLYRRRGNRYFDFDAFDFVARPDSLMPYGIRSAGGYLSIYPRRFRELWNGRGNDTMKFVRPGESIDGWSGGWIDMQSIRYILAAPGSESNKYQVAYFDSGITIFENPNALPRFYFVDRQNVSTNPLEAVKSEKFDPRTTAVVEAAFALPAVDQSLQSEITVEKDRPGNVELKTKTNKSAILVFSENYFPGWQCSVDGQPAELHRADYAFAAVLVPEGSHQVLFRFRPAMFVWALRIFWGVLILWIPAILLTPKAQKKEIAAGTIV